MYVVDTFLFSSILCSIHQHWPKLDMIYSDVTCWNKIWELWRDNKALEIVDSCIAHSCPVHEVLRFIQVGLLCVQDDARDRPTMSTVVFMLCNEATLPCPKQSTFTFRLRNVPESSSKGTNCSANEVTITTLYARWIC